MKLPLPPKFPGALYRANRRGAIYLVEYPDDPARARWFCHPQTAHLWAALTGPASVAKGEPGWPTVPSYRSWAAARFETWRFKVTARLGGHGDLCAVTYGWPCDCERGYR